MIDPDLANPTPYLVIGSIVYRIVTHALTHASIPRVRLIFSKALWAKSWAVEKLVIWEDEQRRGVLTNTPKILQVRPMLPLHLYLLGLGYPS